LVSDTQIHTGFKLGNEDDEVVMLTAADESWADTLSYKMHNGDQSVGLYPDGGKQAYIMDLTTIGQSNKLNSYAVAFEQFRPEPTPPVPTDVKEITSDGGLRVKYENGGISITTDSPMTVSIEIVNAAGQKVYETSTDVYGSKSVGIDGLSVGIYLARVTSDNDNRCQIKFLRK
ncbi:MAG: T9SS type A sorting domain-containing protein, partial [Bacteroidaceae bacterium]|nr:T9SS type A sorting domain-containing protein [Bacteroidaceae bacterium]